MVIGREIRIEYSKRAGTGISNSDFCYYSKQNGIFLEKQLNEKERLYRGKNEKRKNFFFFLKKKKLYSNGFSC